MPTDTFNPEMDQTMNTADATTTHTTIDIVLTTERYNHNRTIIMIHDTLQEHCFLLLFFILAAPGHPMSRRAIVIRSPSKFLVHMYAH